MALVGLALAGCEPRRQPTTRAPVEEVTRTADAAASVPAPARALLRGAIRAHDGSPLRLGHYRIMRNGFLEATASGDLDAQGGFRIALEPGIYQIELSGVDHVRAFRGVWVQDEVGVTGELGTMKTIEHGETISIRAQFLDAAGKPMPQVLLEAARTDSSRYRLALPAAPAEAVALRYQLRKGGHTWNGPLADRWQSDDGGDFWSIVELGERTALELDLSGLPPPDREARLQWTGEDPSSAAATEAVARWRKHGAAERAWPEVEAAPPRLHRWLLLAYLDVFGAKLPKAERIAAVAELIDSVPPDDPRLGLFRSLEGPVWLTLEDGEPAVVNGLLAWLERRAAENPDPGDRLMALMPLLVRADKRGDAS